MPAYSLSGQNELVQLLEVPRKMHKTMAFGYLLFCITFLTIIEGNMAYVCPKYHDIPVNSSDDNLTDECFSIYICCYLNQVVGKVDRAVSSTALNIHGPS